MVASRPVCVLKRGRLAVASWFGDGQGACGPRAGVRFTSARAFRPSLEQRAGGRSTGWRVRPKLPACVLLRGTRFELICDELLVADDGGIMARFDDVRVPGAEFGLRPVVVGYV